MTIYVSPWVLVDYGVAIVEDLGVCNSTANAVISQTRRIARKILQRSSRVASGFPSRATVGRIRGKLRRS